MESKILNLLSENARMSASEIALRAGLDAAAVEAAITDLEKRGVIRGYTAILNESELEDNKVKAIIDVKVTPSREGGFDQVARRIARYPEVIDLSLVSGGFDLLLTIEGNSLQEVGLVRFGQALDDRGCALDFHLVYAEEIQRIRQDYAK